MEQKRTTVGKAHSTIELNGERYNAYTGVLVDGIRAAVPAQLAKQPSVSRSVASSKKIHKNTQPSRTLMRHAVRKPSTITTRKTVAMDVMQQAAAPAAVASRFHDPDPKRLKRAENVRKLSSISRFGGVSTTAHAAQPPATTEAAREIAATPQAPAPVHHQQNHTDKSHDVIEKGLRAANSHEQRTAKKPKLHHRVSRKLGLSNRAAGIAAGSLAVLLFGAFFTYQNVPSMSVRYASAKAGVKASLPGYRPAGFAVSKRIQYSPGQITIAYKTNADSRSYNVSQKNTSWNSEALRDHLVTTTGSDPQSFPDKGRTIYLHDGDQADWVNNGVWYSISGNSELNTDQLIKIATSI